MMRAGLAAKRDANEIREAFGRRLLDLDEVEAARLGLIRGADRVHRRFEMLIEIAREDGICDGRHAELARLTGASHAELGRFDRLELSDERTDLLRNRDIGLDAFG